MFKNTFKIATLLCAALTVCNVAALVPLKDRAVIQYMSADILLPDNSLLNVDMSFDCGSDFSKTAMIITSDAGANLLAAAYSSMYGSKAGEQVLHTWNTKVNDSDPRKPTFLIVTLPENSFENDGEMLTKGKNKLTSDDFNVTMPIIKPYCGSRDHIPISDQ